MLRLRLLKVFRPLCKVHFGAISFHARCIRSYITGQQLQLCLAIATTFVTWTAVMLLGILPVVFVDYFSASFYTKTGLCLALPFAPAQLEGWEFSSAIFVFYNMVIFIVIAACQCVIYQAAKSTSRIIPAKSQRDLQMAKKLFLVVITDFCGHVNAKS
jgi:hypothetical protein